VHLVGFYCKNSFKSHSAELQWRTLFVSTILFKMSALIPTYIFADTVLRFTLLLIFPFCLDVI
jgi:hypothetical protein